ncbi:hypothetical protein [Clostridium felsineum]|uniref:hypothetical protein n=1 Tax=Clostridium felsineum TaxID=36839 RepID=UPI00098C32B2|nr:hypothetical protein [Clostridium felsineum]URZ18462.1 hypothetical protein CLFE_045500 [Clostridium felsineum DSM 794]
MEYKVLKKSGSDASYDLIIEAVNPKPIDGYIINSVNNNNTELLDNLVNEIIDTENFDSINWGLRFNFFQHIPDKWIIEARLEALFKRMEQI